MARQTRAKQSRQATARRPPAATYKGRLFIDPAKVPKGMKYGWVREYMTGEPDDNNVQDRLIKGWKPVPADRHPEVVPPPLPGRESEKSTVIRRGGLILCEIDVATFKELRQAIADENADAIQGIAWTRGELHDDDKRMPMVDFGSSEVQIERVVALPKD